MRLLAVVVVAAAVAGRDAVGVGGHVVVAPVSVVPVHAEASSSWKQKLNVQRKNRSRSDLFTNFPSHYCKVCIPDQIFLEPQTISEPLKARRSIDVKALK